jgi:hypothetical protein
MFRQNYRILHDINLAGNPERVLLTAFKKTVLVLILVDSADSV